MWFIKSTGSSRRATNDTLSIRLVAGTNQLERYIHQAEYMQNDNSPRLPRHFSAGPSSNRHRSRAARLERRLSGPPLWLIPSGALGSASDSQEFPVCLRTRSWAHASPRLPYRQTAERGCGWAPEMRQCMVVMVMVAR